MSKNPGEENKKVIRNPHADPDHHQKWSISRGSFTPCPCLPSLVDVRFCVRQFSCLKNDRVTQNDHITSTCMVDGSNNRKDDHRQIHSYVLFYLLLYVGLRLATF